MSQALAALPPIAAIAIKTLEHGSYGPEAFEASAPILLGNSRVHRLSCCALGLIRVWNRASAGFELDQPRPKNSIGPTAYAQFDWAAARCPTSEPQNMGLYRLAK
jgi:hypothetical protein